MVDTEKLSAMVRQERGKRAVRRLRAQGWVPGVVYGHGQEAVSIAVAAEQLGAAIRHGARVVDVEYNGNAEKALIRELQWDPYGKEILHFDLTRVSLDERIDVEVALELRGTPRGVSEGGVLTQLIHRVKVSCLATNIPSEIRVSVNDLPLGGAIHVRDLPVPPGVTVHEAPDALVARVTAVEEIEVEAPVPGSAEPELIGRREEPEEAEG